jgi:hypothetical protein
MHEKEKRWQPWLRFISTVSNGLFFNDSLIDLWSQKIIGNGAFSSSKFAKIYMYLDSLDKARESVAAAKTPDEERAATKNLEDIIVSGYHTIMELMQSGELSHTSQTVLLVVAFEEFSRKHHIYDSSSITKTSKRGLGVNEGVLREKIRVALVDLFAGKSQEMSAQAGRDLADALGLPGETGEKIGELLGANKPHDAIMAIFDVADQFESNEFEPGEEEADLKDAILTVRPEDKPYGPKYVKVPAETWLESFSKSLGVSPDYVRGVLAANKKETKEDKIVPAEEKRFSKRAQFGLNVLSLFSSGLDDKDPTWFADQYPQIIGAEKVNREERDA